MMLSPFFDKRSFIALLILSIAAIASNYFIFDLFLGLSFLFGSIASLIVLYFGNSWGVLLALISSIPTIFLWHHPYTAIIFFLGILFVALLGRQQQNILLVYMLYWLLIGMPLGFLFYSLFLHLDTTQFLRIILKQAGNKITNALSSTLMITYSPFAKWIGCAQVNNKIVGQNNLLNILICCLFLPLLLLMFLNSNRVVRRVVGDLQSELESTSTLLVTQLQAWHQNHLDKLGKLAQAAVESNIESSKQLQHITELMQQLSPDFYIISIETTIENRIAFSGRQNQASITS